MDEHEICRESIPTEALRIVEDIEHYDVSIAFQRPTPPGHVVPNALDQAPRIAKLQWPRGIKAKHRTIEVAAWWPTIVDSRTVQDSAMASHQGKQLIAGGRHLGTGGR
jgi:hypothetical protein